jgi:hypothetical protein
MEELVKIFSAELAALLLGMKACNASITTRMKKELTEKQVEGEPDWLWNAKWCWVRVHDEIKLYFAAYLADAAKEASGNEVINAMVAIYTSVYTDAEPHDVEVEILDALSEMAKAVPKPAAVGGSAAKKRKARQDTEVNLDLIQTKARKTAEDQVRDKMKALQDQVDQTTSLQVLHDSLQLQLEETQDNLAAALSAKERALGRLATLKSHVLSQKPGYKLHCDDELQWTFIRNAPPMGSPPFGAPGFNAAPSVGSAGRDVSPAAVQEASPIMAHPVGGLPQIAYNADA